MTPGSNVRALSSRFAACTAAAVTPEQLVPYVLAMGGGAPHPCGEGMGYLRGGRLVLAAWPAAGACEPPGASARSVRSPQNMPGVSDAPDTFNVYETESIRAGVDASVERALALPGVEEITVLAPCRPSAAPADAASRRDRYWGLPLPVQAPAGRLGQKWRNTLIRARRDLALETSDPSADPAATKAGAPLISGTSGTAGQKAMWTREHGELVERFLRSRPLGPGSAALFRRIGAYLEAVPGALLFSARSVSGRLEGLCVGDVSALATAFYLFAFRRPDSPPGTADLLLSALAEAAAARGHSRLNLGLGINPGIEFFKRKWGATPVLPYVETRWTPAKKWWRAWF